VPKGSIVGHAALARAPGLASTAVAKEMKRASYDKMKVTAARAGVNRRTFSGEGATLSWVTIRPEATPDRHSHAYEQIVVVESGRAEFEIGSERTILATRDMVVVPPNVEHAARSLDHHPAVLLCVFSPKREAYAAEE
jgi:quercetin dioxygenase-like cupin family protein